MSAAVRVSSLLKSCHQIRLQVRHISYLQHGFLRHEHELANPTYSSSLLLRSSGWPSLHQRLSYAKKSRTGRMETSAEESDSDDDENRSPIEEDVVKTGYSDGVIACNGLRVDAVVKSATNLPRHRIDEAFMEGRLRLNGAKITRKSGWINESDQMDLILGRNKDNNDCLDVYRVEVREVPDVPVEETAKIRIKVRRFKRLMIPNYEREPWMGTAVTEDQ